ncbi:CinA family protein [Arsenicicoccus dermatophilus]|uniref:CinA family protein n=1 Tax=Arsenicicoccus dermatophilus TaxID=1076331 RepID=UPI0030C6AD37
MADPARLLGALEARDLSVAAAESLTGGLVCAALVDVPGASRTVRGGVVSYAYAVKTDLLGVPADLLAKRGAVSEEVAHLMALGVRRVCSADVGLATTGVAGPDPADGRRVGTVWIAVALGPQVTTRRLMLPGDRAAVRAGAAREVIALAHAVVSATPTGPGPAGPRPTGPGRSSADPRRAPSRSAPPGPPAG